MCVCESELACVCEYDRWLYRCSAAICMFPSSVLSLPPSLSVTLTYICFRFVGWSGSGGEEAQLELSTAEARLAARAT